MKFFCDVGWLQRPTAPSQPHDHEGEQPILFYFLHSVGLNGLNAFLIEPCGEFSGG